MENSLDQLKQMLTNVLVGISWSDEEIIKRISAPVYKLFEKNVFNDVLEKEVKSITVSKEVPFEKISPYLKNASKLIVEQAPETLDFSALESPWLSLNELLVLNQRSLKSISGFFNVPNLKNLRVSSSPLLKEINLDADLSLLENITVTASGVENIQGLENAKNLRKLSIFDSKKFKELNIPSEMTKLTEISLSGPGVREIKSLQNVPNLQMLKIQYSPVSGNFEFTVPMKSLKFVSFLKTKMKSLSGIENLSALENLDLRTQGRGKVAIKLKNKAARPTFKIVGSYKFEYEEDI